MTLTIDLSKDLEAALIAHAQAEGVDAAGYARLVLERALGMEEASSGPPLRRVLGWPALTGIGLGTMLGGIFPTIESSYNAPRDELRS